MAMKITLIKGDGSGPELIEQAKRVIDKAMEKKGKKIDWEIFDLNSEIIEENFKKKGKTIPDEIIDSIKRNKICLKGPVTTPIGKGFRSVNVELRKIFDLYVSLRPCKYYKGVRTRIKNPENIDIVVIRENTEDLYTGVEFEEKKKETIELINFLNRNGKKIREDSGISIKAISEFGSERIIKFAFEYALKNKRKKVTCVTKSNIMKFSDGLFLKKFEEISKNYEGKIYFEHKLVDNLAMQLVQFPENFDVLVLPNLYGDIISDLCAGLVGGLGVAPGVNLSNDYAIFEAVHGSAPEFAGKNLLNPTALILSGVEMLKFINENEVANLIERAVKETIEEGKFVTFDLKSGNIDDKDAVGTKEMTNEIIRKIEKF